MTLASASLWICLLAFPQPFTFVHGKEVKKLTPEIAEALERGEVVKFTSVQQASDGRRYGWGTSLGLIKAPFQKVKKLLLNFESFPQFLPNLQELKVLQRTGDTVKAYHKVKALWLEMVYYLYYRIEEGKDELKISWTLDREEKNDLKDTKGYWFIKAWDKERTLLIYSTFVDSGVKMPEVIEKLVMSFTLPRVITGVRSRVEESQGDEREEDFVGF